MRLLRNRIHEQRCLQTILLQSHWRLKEKEIENVWIRGKKSLWLTDRIWDNESSLLVCCHAIERCWGVEAYDKHAPLVPTSGSLVKLTFWCWWFLQQTRVLLTFERNVSQSKKLLCELKFMFVPSKSKSLLKLNLLSQLFLNVVVVGHPSTHRHCHVGKCLFTQITKYVKKGFFFSFFLFSCVWSVCRYRNDVWHAKDKILPPYLSLAHNANHVFLATTNLHWTNNNSFMLSNFFHPLYLSTLINT